jgi:hypothetical protein
VTGQRWPLLAREWRLFFQPPGKHGYPGLFWASLALALPLLYQAVVAYGIEPGFDASVAYRLCAYWLIWLTCLRACMNSAASMAHEMEHHSLSLVRQLPRSGGLWGLLGSKALLVAFPLVLEWLGFGLITLLLCGLGVLSPEQLSWRYPLVAACSSAFFIALGLWIGAGLGESDRAASNARVAVVMSLVGWALLEQVLKGPILLIGALIYVALVLRSTPRVASAFQGGVVSLVLLLLLPQFYLLGDLQLAQLSPLAAALRPELAQDNCLLYVIAALLITGFNYRKLRSL